AGSRDRAGPRRPRPLRADRDRRRGGGHRGWMKSHLKTVVGITLSLLLLAWVLRDVSPGEVAREIAEANLPLLVLSIAVTMCGFAIRAVRWGVLLLPVAPRVPFRPRYAAVMIGFAANNLLPARVGEFARALTLARVGRVSAAASIA